MHGLQLGSSKNKTHLTWRLLHQYGGKSGRHAITSSSVDSVQILRKWWRWPLPMSKSPKALHGSHPAKGVILPITICYGQPPNPEVSWRPRCCKQRSKHSPSPSTICSRMERLTNPLWIEFNCLVLVEAVHNPKSTPWEARALFAERAALLPCFPNLCITHCRTEANFVADWAAKAHGHGTLSPNQAVSPPEILLDLVCFEALAQGCFVSMA